MSETPESNVSSVEVESYKCDNCGAYAQYKPGSNSLCCDYCGSLITIELKKPEHIRELDFEAYRSMADDIVTDATKVVVCHHCNAETTFDEKQKSMQCPYCGTAIMETDVHYQRLIRPSYLQPFKVGEHQVQDCMKRWIKKLWFAPGKLKHRAVRTNQLKSVLVPYWTYDAQTTTAYTGRRGDDYTVTVGQGKNRRTERRTSWRSVSGRVARFFDDVMVPASRLIPPKVLQELQYWNPEEYVEFDKRFQAGVLTEKYSVKFTDGYLVAQKQMEGVIQGDIRSDIGGDHQRISSFKTTYSDVKFKLVLLPFFMSAYTYKGKLYHFYVNGVSGNISGDRPYSAWKIFFAILFGLIAVAALVYVFVNLE